MVKRGFTLMEALVSATLVGIAVAALVGTLGKLQNTQAKLIEAETMQRLALSKYQEIIGTADFTNLSGNFEDQDLPYEWEAELETTSAENIERLSVTVTSTVQEERTRTVYGLVYRPPVATGGTQ